MDSPALGLLRVLGAPTMLVLLGATALQLVAQFAVTGYLAPLLCAERQPDTPVLVALVVFGATFFAGDRLVGRAADRWGAVLVIVFGLVSARRRCWSCVR